MSDDDVEYIDEEEHLLDDSPDQKLREKKDRIIDKMRRKRKATL